MRDQLIPVGSIPLLDFVRRYLHTRRQHRHEHYPTLDSPAGEQISTTFQESDDARGSHIHLGTHNS